MEGRKSIVKEIKDPAFLFYSSDFLTGTLLMSYEEIGKYIKLLCLQHQIGHINSDDFNEICGASRRILSKFKQDSDGNYYNERLDLEIEKRVKHRDKQRENGTKGGRPKNPHKTQTKPKRNPVVKKREAKQKPLENEDINEIENNVFIYDFTSNILLQTCLKEFCEMRNEIKKPLTERALKMLLEKLKGMASDESEMCEILRESIMNSWQGIFPLKNNWQSQVTTKQRGLTLQEKIEMGYYDEQS